MNDSQLSARFRRLERLVMNQTSAIHIHAEIIMAALDDLEQKADAALAAAQEAKADAARQRSLSEQAVGLLQAQKAELESLRTELANGTLNEARITAAADKLQQGLDALAEANVARDESDALVAAGVAEATPAEPAPAP